MTFPTLPVMVPSVAEQHPVGPHFGHGEFDLSVIQIAAADVADQVGGRVPHRSNGVFPVAAAADVGVNNHRLRIPPVHLGKVASIGNQRLRVEEFPGGREARVLKERDLALDDAFENRKHRRIVDPVLVVEF